MTDLMSYLKDLMGSIEVFPLIILLLFVILFLVIIAYRNSHKSHSTTHSKLDDIIDNVSGNRWLLEQLTKAEMLTKETGKKLEPIHPSN